MALAHCHAPHERILECFSFNLLVYFDRHLNERHFHLKVRILTGIFIFIVD